MITRSEPTTKDTGHLGRRTVGIMRIESSVVPGDHVHRPALEQSARRRQPKGEPDG
ncbi:MAG: hypothetical protein ACR2FG_10435 [Marmoricola sp.]